MSGHPQTTAGTAQEMREAFDHGFALPVQEGAQRQEDLLLIQLAQLPHAVRLDEIVGLQRTEGITALPGPLSMLLGISGHKGRILPVYDLSALLGLPPAQRPLWQLVTRSPAVLLAVDDFERHLRCPPEAIAHHAAGRAATHPGHIHAHLHTEQGQRPIVSLEAVLKSIRNLTHRTTREER